MEAGYLSCYIIFFIRKNFYFLPISATGGPTTTTKDDSSNNTTTIVLVVLALITLIIIIAAVVYTLYRKGYLGGREGLQRIRSIVNPGYGQLEETGDSVSPYKSLAYCIKV